MDNYKNVGIGFLGGCVVALTVPMILKKIFQQKEKSLNDIINVDHKIKNINIVGDVGTITMTEEEFINGDEKLKFTVISSSEKVKCTLEGEMILIKAYDPSVQDPINFRYKWKLNGTLDKFVIGFWGRGTFNDLRKNVTLYPSLDQNIENNIDDNN